MSNRHARLTPGHVAPAHRRAARPLDLFTPPAGARTAAALDGVGQAEQLITDLLALVQGKLIEPIADPGGSTRYALRGDELYSAASPLRR